MTPSGIVFDKDGTLFDFQRSWGGWYSYFIDTLAQNDAGLRAALADAMQFDPQTRRFHPSSVFIHDTLTEIVTQLLEHLPDWDFARLYAFGKARAAQVRQVPAAPLRPLFTTLRQKGLRLGIATNDNIAPATAQLQRAGVADMFDYIAGYDSGYGAKPGTGMLDAFCAQNGLPAASVYMVGDSPHDLKAGKDAGMQTIAVLTGPASRADLAPLADEALNHIGEIPALIR